MDSVYPFWRSRKLGIRCCWLADCRSPFSFLEAALHHMTSPGSEVIIHIKEIWFMYHWICLILNLFFFKPLLNPYLCFRNVPRSVLMKQHLGVNKWYHESILIAKKDFNKGSHAQGWPFHPQWIIDLFPYFFHWLVKTSFLISIRSFMIVICVPFAWRAGLWDVCQCKWRVRCYFGCLKGFHLFMLLFHIHLIFSSLPSPQTYRVKWSLKMDQNGIYCEMISWWEHLWKTGTRKVMERAILNKEVVWNKKMTVTEWNWKLSR